MYKVRTSIICEMHVLFSFVMISNTRIQIFLCERIRTQRLAIQCNQKHSRNILSGQIMTYLDVCVEDTHTNLLSIALLYTIEHDVDKLRS